MCAAERMPEECHILSGGSHGVMKVHEFLSCHITAAAAALMGTASPRSSPEGGEGVLVVDWSRETPVNICRASTLCEMNLQAALSAVLCFVLLVLATFSSLLPCAS